MQLGRFPIESPIVLAPMAGVTDWAYRCIAAQLGAALGISEEKILNALAKPYNDLSLIAQLYPDELTDELKEKLELIDGVSIDIGSYGTLRDIRTAKRWRI